VSSRARSDRCTRCRNCRRLEDELAEREREVEKLRTENAALKAKLEDERRKNKRQAAPFSKDRRTPDKERKAPGRKPGAAYGRHARRMAPEVPDEDIEVPLPDACPHCGSDLCVDTWSEQYQDEIVSAVVHRRFRVALGHCPDCDRSVRGRHSEQTSNALGAAGVMLGPKAIALGAWLHYGCGVSAAKVARLFGELGLSVSASGITQALGRLGNDASGTYDALIQALRMSPIVSPDETGWRVDAERRWLWVYVGDHVTVYDIAAGRGYDGASQILGEDYSGIICRDGWAPYRRFTSATHQTCLAHLLRRANEMIADAKAGQARIPHALRRLLEDALALRTKRDAGELGPRQFARAIKQLEERADSLLAARVTYEPNRRLLAHLRNERDALFTFLRHEGVPATNHEAERAIRPQVVTRKNWGGNKSWAGARSAAVLGSVTRTAVQQGKSPIATLVQIATSDGANSGLELANGQGP
jgi:transposase